MCGEMLVCGEAYVRRASVASQADSHQSHLKCTSIHSFFSFDLALPSKRSYVIFGRLLVVTWVHVEYRRHLRAARCQLPIGS